MTPPTSVLGPPGLRLLSLSVLFHSLAFIGEQVVLGWVVLELTDSAALVGVAFAVRLIPFLIMGLPGGVLADRYDRTWLLQSTGVFMAAAIAGLGALVLGRKLGLWPVLLIAFMVGCAHAINQAARQSRVHDLVGPNYLMSAVALLGFTMRGAELLGSLGTGVLITQLGSGLACFGITACYLMSAVVLSSPRAIPGPPGEDRKPGTEDGDGGGSSRSCAEIAPS